MEAHIVCHQEMSCERCGNIASFKRNEEAYVQVNNKDLDQDDLGILMKREGTEIPLIVISKSLNSGNLFICFKFKNLNEIEKSKITSTDKHYKFKLFVVSAKSNLQIPIMFTNGNDRCFICHIWSEKTKSPGKYTNSRGLSPDSRRQISTVQSANIFKDAPIITDNTGKQTISVNFDLSVISNAIQPQPLDTVPQSPGSMVHGNNATSLKEQKQLPSFKDIFSASKILTRLPKVSLSGNYMNADNCFVREVSVQVPVKRPKDILTSLGVDVPSTFEIPLNQKFPQYKLIYNGNDWVLQKHDEENQILLENRFVRWFLRHKLNEQYELACFYLQMEKSNQESNVIEKLIKKLTEGIEGYKYLLSSNSSLKRMGGLIIRKKKDNTFDTNFNPYEEVIQKLIRGNFDEAKKSGIAKYFSRLGLSLGSSLEIPGDFIVVKIPDIGHVEYPCTDGIGIISESAAAYAAHYLKLGTVPSAFQIRILGCKGVVSRNPTHLKELLEKHSTEERKLTEKDLVVFVRDSMEKYSTTESRSSLDVLNFSDSFPGHLNRSVLCALEGIFQKNGQDSLKKFRETILIMTREQLSPFYHAFSDDTILASIMESEARNAKTSFARSLYQMFKAGHGPKEPHFAVKLYYWITKSFEDIWKEARFKILLPSSRYLMGVIDEIGFLKEGEVCVIYQDRDFAGENITMVNRTFLEGKVLVTRHPCVYPGDIQCVKAVKPPKSLEHMYNVIIFPQTKERPLQHFLGGGDLDGDLYLVIADNNLVFEQNCDPLPYENTKGTSTAINDDDKDQFYQDIVKHFCKSITEDHVGLTDYQSKVIYDNLGPLHEMNHRIGKIYGIALDAVKTGQSVKEDLDKIKEELKSQKKFIQPLWHKMDNTKTEKILEEKYGENDNIIRQIASVISMSFHTVKGEIEFLKKINNEDITWESFIDKDLSAFHDSSLEENAKKIIQQFNEQLRLIIERSPKHQVLERRKKKERDITMRYIQSNPIDSQDEASKLIEQKKREFRVRLVKEYPLDKLIHFASTLYVTAYRESTIKRDKDLPNPPQAAWILEDILNLIKFTSTSSISKKDHSSKVDHVLSHLNISFNSI